VLLPQYGPGDEEAFDEEADVLVKIGPIGVLLVLFAVNEDVVLTVVVRVELM
jgi:hypothetical protein